MIIYPYMQVHRFYIAVWLLVVIALSAFGQAPLPTRWHAPQDAPRPAHALPPPAGPAKLTRVPVPANTIHTPAPQGRVCLLVENALLPALTSALAQYTQDLQYQGYSVVVVAYIDGGAAAIRAQLAALYAEPDSLKGAVLLGNLPCIIYEMMQDWGSGAEYEDFPCDLYYMDLNGEWSDTLESGQVHANNGKYDTRTGNTALEIWVSRLRTDNLGLGNATEVMIQYFAKNHRYRAGLWRPSHAALVYNDDDWNYMAAGDKSDISTCYPADAITPISDNETTTAADYKANRLPVNQEMIFLRSHGYAAGHGFYQQSRSVFNFVDGSDYRAILPPALFYSLFVCSGSDFTASNNLGSLLACQPDAGLLTWGSTKTGGMWAQTSFFTTLGSGKPFGEALRVWFNTVQVSYSSYAPRWWYGMVMMGDGALSLATTINSPPIAQSDAYTTSSDIQLVVSTPGVLGNDNDVDGNQLTAETVIGPVHGTMALAIDGSFTYMPAAGFAGNDTFTYRASDGMVSSVPVTVTITINHIYYEADVSPRDTSGDGQLSTTDWVMIGRFVASLSSYTVGREFQKADCAPSSTLGDGHLSLSDWVQAGRYIAALDDRRLAGGPMYPAGAQ